MEKILHLVKSERFKAIIVIIILFVIGLWVEPFRKTGFHSDSVFKRFIATSNYSLGVIPFTYSLLFLFRGKPKFSKLMDILFCLIIFSIIEILALFNVYSTGTFDFNDIIALFIGAGITFLIFK